jgi:hypothetical protein
MPELISRRELLLASVSAVMLPHAVMASGGANKAGDDCRIDWSEFQDRMTALAAAEAGSNINQQAVAENGLRYLKQLDIHSATFNSAIDNAYETGNRFWLWQRMVKGENINGGILTIDSEQLVQLHDHPGATGLLRIISGEAEVWQFDEKQQGTHVSSESDQGSGEVELIRVSRHILKAGDTAVLTPDKGNIHALRAVSKQCSMLDFFIPPYERSQRSWYEPLAKNWFDQEKLSCRKIPQHAYTKA